VSRSGLVDDYENDWSQIRWRGQVASAIRGKRGQAFLRDLIAALDAMPQKRLIANDIVVVDEVSQETNVCALGSVLLRRGVPTGFIDPDDDDHREELAGYLNIAPALVSEVEWLNDDGLWGPTPEERWQFIRDWAVRHLKNG